MMVIAVGLSSYNLALFHLVNHAFYKGLLFLGAGAVIHAWADNQDFRKYGGLRAFLPLTYTVMLIASLSLVAFPFMTGFYSKDFILESAYGHYSFSSLVVYFVATIGAMFTTLYSVKVLYLTFLTNPNGPLTNYNKAHEGDIFMSIPLIILALFSIFFGYLTKDIFIGIASGFFSDNSLFIHPSHEVMLDTEFAVPTLFKLLPLVLTISLTILSFVLSEYLPFILVYFKFSILGYNIFSFFNQRFLIELLYNKYITGAIFKLGGQTTKVLDNGFVEIIGPFGMEKFLLNFSKNIARLDTGVITSYALYILIGLLSYIFISFFSILDSALILLIIFALYINLGEFKSSNNIKVIIRIFSLSNIMFIGLFSVCICFTGGADITQAIDSSIGEVTTCVSPNINILNELKNDLPISHPSDHPVIADIDNKIMNFFRTFPYSHPGYHPAVADIDNKIMNFFRTFPYSHPGYHPAVVKIDKNIIYTINGVENFFTYYNSFIINPLDNIIHMVCPTERFAELVWASLTLNLLMLITKYTVHVFSLILIDHLHYGQDGVHVVMYDLILHGYNIASVHFVTWCDHFFMGRLRTNIEFGVELFDNNIRLNGVINGLGAGTRWFIGAFGWGLGEQWQVPNPINFTNVLYWPAFVFSSFSKAIFYLLNYHNYTILNPVVPMIGIYLQR